MPAGSVLSTGSEEEHGSDAGPSLAGRVARSAGTLALRQGIVLVLGAIGAAAITRLLGPSSYGSYASAIATWTLLGAAADFGFSTVLARDLASDRALHRPMLRSAYKVGTLWSLLLALAVAGLGVAAGPSSARGIALLILAPSMVFNGLNAARTLYLVMFRARLLMWIDLVSTFMQVAGMIAVAAARLGPIAVAAVVSVTAIGNAIVSAIGAERLLAPDAGQRFSGRELLRRSSPLGLLGVMNKTYLMFDVVLLGWLVSSAKVGQYAAAAKLLTILASVTALVMNASLPALARRQSRDQLELLLARVWHWLMVCALPVFTAAAIFAPEVIHIAVGYRYTGAINLLRILVLAGVVSILSNFLGMLMVATHRTRALFSQTSAAIILNIGGNLLFIPMIGVSAAAWMTAATEVLVCVCAAWSLREYVSLAGCVSVSKRPVLAILPAAGLAWLLRAIPVVGVPALAVVFVGLVMLLGGWPTEFARRPAHLQLEPRRRRYSR